MKENIKVTIYEKESEWDLPTNPDEFIKYWQEKFNQIPVEYKDNATVDVEANTYYDGAQLSIEIYYYRSETDDEEAKREQQEKEQAERNKQRELNELDRLRKKYGV